MITSFFKNNLVSYIFIPILAAILWATNYYNITLQTPIKVNIGLDSYTFSVLQFHIITYSIAIITGFILNIKIKKHLFNYDPSNLTFLFYILFSSLCISTSNYLWLITCSSILVLILHYLFIFNEKNTLDNSLFNSAFLVGILFLINIQFIALITFLLLSYSSISKLSFKHISLVIIGVFLPFIYVVLFSSLTDNNDVISYVFDVSFSLPTLNWKTIGLLLLILTPSVFGFITSIQKRSGTDASTLRVMKIVFTLFLFISLISISNMFTANLESFFALISVPASILITAFFKNSPSIKKEILFVLIVIFCVFYR